MSEDPGRIKEAKRIAAGPLGEQMGKFPLLFGKVVVIGQPPSMNFSSKVTNATVTLIDLGTGPLGLTCAHVLAGYREMRQQFDNAVFQVGNVDLDPLQQLVTEDTDLDLAIFRFSKQQISALTSESGIGSCVFCPVSWPSAPVKVGDFVAFGGFPGSLRELLSFDELAFPSWSSGASRVKAVTDDRFSCVFEREYWVSSFGQQHHMKLRDLGGMSGGPAFIKRDLYWDFAGLIYEFSKEFDIMFFRPASLFASDGTIQGPTV